MTHSINWAPVLIMFVLPLGLGVISFLVASRFRWRWVRLVTRLFGTAMLLIFLFFAYFTASYLWALHLESKWHAARPKTRAELEACLSLYWKKEISPSHLKWGNYQPAPGEHVTEYRLLYFAPLDVVYTTNDAIVNIYTTYE
jgi:hypothetical protein